MKRHTTEENLEEALRLLADAEQRIEYGNEIVVDGEWVRAVTRLLKRTGKISPRARV